MRMIDENLFPLYTTNRDDPRFIETVERLVGSAVRFYRPGEIFIVKIEHWFDQKWKAFSGKVLGALGVHKYRLTLPPFNPHRVLSEVHYAAGFAGGVGYTVRPAPPLHIDQWSDANMRRYVECVSRDGLFVWYSGGTATCDAASLMVYTTSGDETGAWYASFRKVRDWRLNKTEGISRRELSVMLRPTPLGV